MSFIGNIRKFINTLLCILAAAAVFAAGIPLTARASGDIVYVGANPSFGISKSGTSHYGLAYDYFENIKRITGHSYVYVDGTPEELFEMLLDRKIDVIPCVTRSEAELYTALLSGEDASLPVKTELPIMTKYYAIYVYENGSGSDISYADVQALRNANIGYLAEDAERYFNDGKFVLSNLEGASFVLYNTESQMRADLVGGKVDAVVKDCFRAGEDENIVYMFSDECSYIAVSGEDPLLATEINSAIANIAVSDPTFLSEVYEKNLSGFGAQKMALTDSEKKYILKNPVIDIAYNASSAVVDDPSKVGSLSGLSENMIGKMSLAAGVKINLVECASLTECIEKLNSGEADAIYGGVNMTSMEAYTEYSVTRPLIKSPMAIAGRQGTSLSGTLKIAVPFYGDDITKYVKLLYPGSTILPYDNVRKCMAAVSAGQADVVCAGAYELVYLMNNEYESFSLLEVLNDYHCERIAVKSDNSALFGIFEKSMALIGSTEMMTLSYESMVYYISETNSAGQFLDKYLWLFITVAAVLVLVIAALILTMYIKGRRNGDTDSLTGGRSKRRFLEDSQRAVRKTSPEKWALVLFDIDKFKYINDRLGYEEGNRMLERLYKTIGDHLADDEIYARTSNDNFALTIHNASDNELTTKVQNIFDEFGRRNALFVRYPVIFSAGICRLGQCVEKNGSVDMNAALDRCTIAKKTIKGMHSHAIAFYDGKIRDKVLREKDYENVMPTALAEHEFQCYLQPKYGLKSRHIEGAEALIRWNSKEFGFVYPNDFIPLSEKNGFVVELDFFILEEVCKTMRRWLDDGKTPVVVSVNQSRLHLNYDDYIWRLREIVDKYEIPYEYIELELTESVFTENADLLLKVMKKLHEIGFKLSIDDFGSGYSSLNMLKDIPADVVKIDREFFNGTVNSQKGRAVISTVVDLAKNLNMEVISEGVETEDQVNFLTEIDCAMVQGYYFAKPMTIKDFEELWNTDLDLKAKEEREKAEQERQPAGQEEQPEVRENRKTDINFSGAVPAVQ